MQRYIEEAFPRGYVAAYRLLGDRDAAYDACQETAMRVWASRDRYDTSKPFYPWYYRILRNYCLDRLSRRKQVDSEVDVVEDQKDSVEERLIEGERVDVVSRAISRLSDDLREVIELRHFQELSYDEMAIILKCPKGTVMSRLYRARKSLRKLLIEDTNFSFDSKNGVK